MDLSPPESFAIFFSLLFTGGRENKTDLRIVVQMLWQNVEDELVKLVFTSFGNEQGVQKEKTAPSILGLVTVF